MSIIDKIETDASKARKLPTGPTVAENIKSVYATALKIYSKRRLAKVRTMTINNVVYNLKISRDKAKQLVEMVIDTEGG